MHTCSEKNLRLQEGDFPRVEETIYFCKDSRDSVRKKAQDFGPMRSPTSAQAQELSKKGQEHRSKGLRREKLWLLDPIPRASPKRTQQGPNRSAQPNGREGFHCAVQEGARKGPRTKAKTQPCTELILGPQGREEGGRESPALAEILSP